MKTIRSRKCKNGARIELVEKDDLFLLIGIGKDGSRHLLSIESNRWDGDLDYAINRFKRQCSICDNSVTFFGF